MRDSYHTIERESKTEIKEKGSRFIGESFIVLTTEESQARLQAVRKREHAASHHCYAYQIRSDDSAQFKYSDDGEPSGAAGKPIYDVIGGHSLTNILIVVTRYFGGTKLGTGGLARAYSGAAQSVLAVSGKREVFRQRRFRVTLDFQQYDRLRVIMRNHHVNVVESDFAESVKLLVDVRIGQVDAFKASCAELSSGRILIEEISS